MLVRHKRRNDRVPHIPSMYGGIDVSKVPLVRWDLPIWLHVPLSRQQVELLLRERRVDHRERNTVECGIPSCEKRIFPSGQLRLLDPSV